MYSCCLQRCHPVWVLVEVAAVPLPILLPANALEKLVELAQVLGPFQLHWRQEEAPPF